MASESVQEKLTRMKQIRKILFYVSLGAAVLALGVLIGFNFAPVFNLTLEGSDKFGAPGFTYPGWQAIYWGIGIQYIPGYTEFNFDPITCLGMFAPALALLVCTALYSNGKNKMKAILEFTMAFCLLLGGIILFNVDKISILYASSTGIQSFKDVYLLPAVEAGTFTKKIYPTITLLVCLLSALIKIGNGVFLLYQRDFAHKNLPQAHEAAAAK
jgi:hypothetical protein